MKQGFDYVPERQYQIDTRLTHWARWVRVNPQAWRTTPMFRGYRSHAWQWERPEPQIQINTLDAHETERAVCSLPEKHRRAIQWCYVFAYIPPNAIRRELAVTRDGLMQLIIDGRDMLKNRLAQKLFDTHA